MGDAGQAKPHLEHNPLSLLGACHATPIRKLNDPAIEWQVIDKAKLMYNFSGAVMPLIIGDVTRFFGRLHLRKQVGILTMSH